MTSSHSHSILVFLTALLSLSLALISLLLLSRPLVLEFWRIANPNGSEPWNAPLLACVLLCVALGATISNLSNIVRTPRGSRADQLFAAPWQVNLFVLLPAAGAIWLLWAWWWGNWNNQGVWSCRWVHTRDANGSLQDAQGKAWANREVGAYLRDWQAY